MCGVIPMTSRKNCILGKDARACDGLNCRRCGWDVSEFKRRLMKIRNEGLTDVGPVFRLEDGIVYKTLCNHARGLRI